jgi:hypothetical protein
MEISLQKVPNSWKNKIYFLQYVCYCPAKENVFKTFFVLHPTQLGFGEGITTLDDTLYGKVLHAY